MSIRHRNRRTEAKRYRGKTCSQGQKAEAFTGVMIKQVSQRQAGSVRSKQITLRPREKMCQEHCQSWALWSQKLTRQLKASKGVLLPCCINLSSLSSVKCPWRRGHNLPTFLVQTACWITTHHPPGLLKENFQSFLVVHFSHGRSIYFDPHADCQTFFLQPVSEVCLDLLKNNHILALANTNATWENEHKLLRGENKTACGLPCSWPRSLTLDTGIVYAVAESWARFG